MATPIQVVFDCADPSALAPFWAAALGYIEQPPPDGFDSWEDWARETGIPEENWNDAGAVVDPDGVGPRIYFQRVPEGKVLKNRVHLDVNVGKGLEGDERRAKVEQEAKRLEGLDASTFRRFDERGEFWIVMQDPEGNEFCLQ
ncbi:MAG: VOC family protein [Actinomycetota bacterium]|nr:VOC family protein [Actinomycetota bacterium]